MDVEDHAPQRVLCVAIGQPGRPGDGVIADELVVLVPIDTDTLNSAQNIPPAGMLQTSEGSGGHALAPGFLQQGGVVRGQVHTLPVHTHPPGQVLKLLLHMHHVLLDGVEGRLRANLVCATYVYSTGRRVGGITILRD